jgi:hypothetical protein
VKIELVLVLAVVACRPAPAPPPPHPRESAEPRTEIVCAVYGYRALLVAGPSADPAFDAAQAAAEADDAAAQFAASRGDHGTAARRYLDCAARFRAVVAASQLRFAATANAKICYGNAITAFANASRLASAGRAALEDAAGADPLLEEYIHRRLADAPSECAR